jgi:hypothetical protein
MDITQIVIIVSLIAITGVIIGVGIWVIKLLKELKQTLVKTNSILDDTKLITTSVAQPVSSISEFLMGFKNGMSFFNNLFKKKEQHE